MSASDERTLRITVKAPYAPFLSQRAATDRDMWLIPPETIDSGQVTKDPVGTGPYVFERLVPDQFMAWNKNPAYYDAPLPNFDRVEAGIVGDLQKTVAALQSGGYDFSWFNAQAFNDARAVLDPAGSNVVVQTSVQNAFHFNFDNQPFNDVRVRRALSMAVDRAGMLRILDPTNAGDWCSFVPPGHTPYFVSPRDNNAAYGANAKYWNRNVKDARDLLRAATGSDTLAFKLVVSTNLYGPVFAQAVQLAANTIREAGFEATIVDEIYADPYFRTTYLGKIAPGSIAFGPITSARDPDDVFMANYHSKGGTRNWGGTPIPEQPELDAMFEKQRTLLDQAEREAYVKQIQFKMAESFLFVPSVVPSLWVYSQPWLKNFHFKDSWAPMADGVMKAYFTPERIKKG